MVIGTEARIQDGEREFTVNFKAIFANRGEGAPIKSVHPWIRACRPNFVYPILTTHFIE
jgi:hypothetical protein